MAVTKVFLDQGLDLALTNISQTTGYSSSTYVQTLSVDDNASTILATDTTVDRLGALTITNYYDQGLDATPAAPSAQTTTHISTISAGSAAFNHTRVWLHDLTAASCSSSSTTVVAGVSGIDITPNGIDVIYRFKFTASDTSV